MKLHVSSFPDHEIIITQTCVCGFVCTIGKHTQFWRIHHKSDCFRRSRQHSEHGFDVWISADTAGEPDRLLRHFNIPVTAHLSLSFIQRTRLFLFFCSDPCTFLCSKDSVEQTRASRMVLRTAMGTVAWFILARKAVRQLDQKRSVLEKLRRRDISVSVHAGTRAGRPRSVLARRRLRQGC